MDILIIGCGWYGCHLALCLINLGYTITMVDKSNDFFNGSSSKNQNRLHLGFHYPRSKDTINECQKGYNLFLQKYGSFCANFYNNNYYISKVNSKITNHDFSNLFENMNIKYESIHSINTDIVNIEYPYYRVDELYIDYNKAKSYFKTILSDKLYKIYDSSKFNSIDSIIKETNRHYDIILNCTYNQLNPIDFDYYELFITYVYQIDFSQISAVTIMDGPFFSIYPYDIENKLYTVTSVNNSIIYSGKLHDYTVSEDEILKKRILVEGQVKDYIPNWSSISEYSSYFLSWKTKPKTNSDDRSLRVEVQNNIVNFYGGKITGIFSAQEKLEEILKNVNNN